MLGRTLAAIAILSMAALPAFAQDPVSPQDALKGAIEQTKGASTVEVILLVTVLALAPSILVLLTSFTRIVVVLSFLRRALSTQDLPPNQVIVGLSLVLTLLVMAPTLVAIKRDAFDPYVNKKIERGDALARAEGPIRAFMLKHARAQDVALFMDTAGKPARDGGWTEAEVPTEVLIPAFVVGELRRAFVMGFAIFLPFLVIDLVVATLLVSMGMFMLPPMLVSLPFKILLFVLVDGWALVVGSVMRSFG